MHHGTNRDPEKGYGYACLTVAWALHVVVVVSGGLTFCCAWMETMEKVCLTRYAFFFPSRTFRCFSFFGIFFFLFSLLAAFTAALWACSIHHTNHRTHKPLVILLTLPVR